MRNPVRRIFTALTFLSLLLTAASLSAQEVTIDPETGEPVFTLDDFSDTAQSLEKWKLGGWQGKNTSFEVDLSVTEDDALRVQYRRGGRQKYFHLYRRGSWDLSGLSHVRVRFKGTRVGQRIIFHLTDEDGNWAAYGGRPWWCEQPGSWKLNTAALGSPNLPRTPPQADLENIVYIACQVKPPKGHPAGEIFIDEVEFYRANVLENGGFEAGLEHWQVDGDASVTRESALEGERCLRLHRAEGEQAETVAASERFRIEPGTWEIRGALKSKNLFSPDPSYNIALSMEAFNSSGERVGRRPLGKATGTTVWKRLRRRWHAPEGSHTARIVARMNKTHGTGRIDALSVKRVWKQGDGREEESPLEFRCGATGNLFFPSDSPTFTLRIPADAVPEAKKPEARFEVRSYWGARQGRRLKKPLTMTEDGEEGKRYTATVDLSPLPLETGLYYELHARVPGTDGLKGVTSFAVLPEAVTHRYEPEKIPFGTQGWTMRRESAQRIGDRLGCRWVRFRWSWPQPDRGGPILWDRKKDWRLESVLYRPVRLGFRPYHLLGPGHHWESGGARYSLEDLRRGMRQSIRRYGDDGLRAFKLGNEPPGWKPEVVKRAVKGWRALYEAIKKADPDALVLSSSLNNNRERFIRAGTARYCDALDVHFYRDLETQRKQTRQVVRWMKKYASRKPLWCTEMGTKGVGLSRLRRAVDCVAKQTAFFADGGAHVDWFALQAARRHRGTFKDAFCLYNPDNTPRLDAVTYYHYINFIATKTFADETAWRHGTRAFLFRDGKDRCGMVLWNRESPRVIRVPLDGAERVTAIYLDGRKTTLSAENGGVTVRATREPLMLSFKGGLSELPSTVGSPDVTVPGRDEPLEAGRAGRVSVRRNAREGSVKLTGPTNWTIERGNEAEGITNFRVQVPVRTPVDRARFFVRVVGSSGRVRGELLFYRQIADR